MCTACWIPNAKSTHSEYVILNAFPLQQLKTYSDSHFFLSHIKTDKWPQRLTMIQVFWNVILCDWVNGSQSLKGPSWDEAFQKGQPTPEKVRCIERATG
jgi:hypothetical protein